MIALHLGNWARFATRLLGEAPVRALVEAPLRGALGGLISLAWALEPRPPPPRDLVVIVGHQRSGTTWLHRMLASHPSATALPLHALLLPIDPLQRWLGRRAAPPWLDRVEERLFGPLRPIHRIGFREHEEDEFLLWTLCRSRMGALDRPWRRPPEIRLQDDDLRCYAHAVGAAQARAGRRIVGKNPHATTRIPALRAAIPGVRLVQLVRHPVEAICSRLSLIRAIWRRQIPGFQEMNAAQVARIVDYSCEIYLAGHGSADLDVAYADLIADPLGTVQHIHATLGLEPWPSAALAALGAHQRSGPSAHRYGPEDFGLDPEVLARKLAPIYDRWGFEVRPAPTRSKY